MSSDHTHYIGTGGKCTTDGCDYVLQIGRWSVGIDIWDNGTKRECYNDVFSTDSAELVANRLEHVARLVRASDRPV